MAAPSFFDRIFDGGLASMQAPADSPSLLGYLELALRGAWPETVALTSVAARTRWLDSYAEQLLLRDAALLDEHRDPARLRRYLVALAANTAGVVDHRSLYQAADISRNTAFAYDATLELLFVTERLPSWHTNRLSRLVKRPKRHLIDPALLVPLLRVDPRGLLRDGDLLGRVVELFVLAQLRPEADASRVRVPLSHLRLDDGSHECDVVADGPNGAVLAIEVMSTSAPDRSDARHLMWLRDRLADRFVGGVVFHTGPRAFTLDGNIRALPISTLWAV